MGICSSHELNSVATAKLIFEDGQLQEFLYPVRVSQMLHKNSNYFICKADDMNYDDYISAMHGCEELQLDQLYFALPVSWLHRPLKAPEMAAFAVKASLALKATDGRQKSWCEIRRVDPLVGNVAVDCKRAEIGCGSGSGRGLALKTSGGARTLTQGTKILYRCKNL